MKKHQHTGLIILIGLIFLALFVSSLFKDKGELVQLKPVGYSEFVTLIRARQLKSVEFSGNNAYGNALTVPAAALPGAPSSGSSSTTSSERSRLRPGQPGPSHSAESASKQAASSGRQAAGGQQVLPAPVSPPSSARPSLTSPTPVADGSAAPAAGTIVRYHTVLPEGGGGVQLLVPELQKANIPFQFREPKADGQWLGILTSVFLPILFMIILFVIFRSAQGGGSQALSFGKSRAKLAMDNKVKITFNDVAGIDESKAELEEVVDFLKNSERYQKLGAKIPKGVLLVGSPGTGKTLLAKAVAGEAGVPFFSISGSDFVEMFVGVGASRVRDLFEQAKKHAPCIIFVDEIDAVGRQRGAGLGGGHDEREQTLNQLLVEMDGFDPHTGIIVVAATNRPDILDNALLRPGRFDRQVMIDRPDVQGREQILKVHAKGKPLASDVDLKLLAKRTPGFTGADLANLLNEGALLAARHEKEVIHQSDIEQSIDKVLAGPEKKSKIMTEKDKELTAYHEVGHALVAVMTTGCDPLRKVTIIPRGMALGITWTMPDADKVHLSRQQLIATIAMALGGRAAEEVVFQDITTGASSDLEKVTSLARKIVTVYGMNEKLGPIQYGRRNEHVFMGRDFGTERDYSEEVATVIDREVKRLVDEQYEYAKGLLVDNRDMVDAIVKVLLEKETLDDKEFMDIIEEVKAARKNGKGYTPVSPEHAADEPEPGAPLVVAPGGGGESCMT
jgi:cell division protease FtsH